MAYTTITKSKSHFNQKIYTGTGSAASITGVGFQPDWVWIKRRDATQSNVFFDVLRGTGKRIMTNETAAEETDAQTLTAFGADGFSVGTSTQVNNSSSSHMSWNWKGGGSGSSNSDATGSYPITSTVSANQTSGVSIVKYTGNGYSTATIGHGLGAKVECIIMRPLGYVGAWWIAHKGLSTDNVLEFNNNAQANVSTFGGGGLKYSTFTNAVFGGGNGSSNSDLWNKSGENYIAYCFAEKQGFSKFGRYYGNNNANGPFVYTGFRPQTVIVKKINSTGYWTVNDNIRNSRSDSDSNPSDRWIYPNVNDAEYDASSYTMDLLSNGFKIRHNGNYQNASNTYIYLAFGQSLVGSNNIPCTAR
jgi:hypothetical protein